MSAAKVEESEDAAQRLSPTRLPRDELQLNPVQVSADVALLAPTEGCTSDNHEIVLPRGQVGIVIEARDPAVVVVEFRDTADVVYAVASVRTEHLLPLHHTPRMDLT